MKCKLVVMASAVALSSAAFAQGTSSSSATQDGRVPSVEAQYTRSMEKLQAGAQRLRESIQALAQKPPGRERDQALAKAHEALLTTQQAMLDLPPELRSAGTVSTADYDTAVKKLMQSADSLRESIQAMAQQPAGERRNTAIETANRALWDTQMAMIHAYQPGSAGTQSSGAGRSGDTTGKGKQAVKDLREDSRSVSQGARQGAVEARKNLDGGPGSSPERRNAPAPQAR